ncbi:MAG TPA: TIGR00300 family protein, partial [Methanomicrobiales archaeon]|nr:TIGR00300 family protein [Methanomicrobiales archaeon]
MEASREIELEGHIIDSGIMTQVFDRIMDMEGNFEILEFNVGKRKTDPSYAKLRVKARDEPKLGLILSELHRFGARPVEIADCHLVPAEGNRIAPREFYSTTNHPTFIRYQGKWIPVDEMKMDSLVVFDPGTGRAVCKTLSKLLAGEMVVVGEEGVKVVPPSRPRKQSLFEFMHGT